MHESISLEFSQPSIARGRAGGPNGTAGRGLHPERLHAVLEHAFDAIWLLGADGTLRWASRAAGCVGDAPAAADLLHPDDAGAFRHLFTGLVGQLGAQRIARFRLRRPGGTWQSAEARIRNLLADPDVGAVVVDWRLIDELPSTDVAAVNRELETFSYSVSHDLRAPLRCIDGFANILLQDCSDGLDDRGRYCVERIHAGARRMNELIDSLLDLSGVTRAPMTRQQVDLSALAAAVADDLRERAPQRAVELVIAGDVCGDGDPRLLRILMQNLLDNAWKYTSQRTAARIEFGVLRQAGRPVFFVRDNGAGFDMRQAQRLFGPFQRLHDSQQFDGTGIGLATVQRIVHRHGGRVWGEGAVDQGATFFFTLGA